MYQYSDWLVDTTDMNHLYRYADLCIATRVIYGNNMVNMYLLMQTISHTVLCSMLQTKHSLYRLAQVTGKFLMQPRWRIESRHYWRTGPLGPSESSTLLLMFPYHFHSGLGLVSFNSKTGKSKLLKKRYESYKINTIKTLVSARH